MYYVVVVVQFDTRRREEVKTVIHVSDNQKRAEEIARNYQRYGYKLDLRWEHVDVYGFESWHIIAAGKLPNLVFKVGREDPE